MIKKVVETRIETRIYWRVLLECGHLYSRPIPAQDHVKKFYVCHSCKNQKEREERGARKNLKGRKNNATKV